MDKETHEVRMRQWFETIQAWSSSGQPKTVWCKENGICLRQFYYWQRTIRLKLYGEMEKHKEAALPEPEVPALPEGQTETLSVPTFAEVPLTPVVSEKPSGFEAAAVIKSGSITIELSNTASEELLARIGKVIYGAI